VTPAPLVLVVEDEPRNQALVRAVFAGTEIELAFATTVAEARAAVARRRPSLVLLDLRLPDEPGTVLAREMRANPDLASVTILAVTASVLEADRRAALDAGCDGFVEKPISPRDLLAKVRGRLENPARE
jgi:two-component system, cell cycle response regulator DivK